VRTIELGNSGIQVGQLGLGCMKMGTATDEPTSVRILDHFLDLGGNFLDTANCYCWWERPGEPGGHSEELLGRWLAADPTRRDRIVLATKGSAVPRDPAACFTADGQADWDEARRQFEGAGGDTLRQAVDGSLRRLGTDHIDLYYVHVDDVATPLEETLDALAGLITAGKIRSYGYSNVRTWRLARIEALCERYGWPTPVAVQQRHSYLRPRVGVDDLSAVGPEQLDYLRTHPQITLVPYSPILGGIYDDVAKRERNGLMASYRGADMDARLAALGEVAADAGCSLGQAALSWLLHQTDPVTVPLIGPRTFEQYETAVPALDVKLTTGQLEQLENAGQ
jgi:aryl-alcohol dehydrogenase-like predicted oxidoreductase